MSMEHKLAVLRNRMKTAGGKKGATVKLGDTGFTASLDILPAQRTSDGLVKAAEKVGLKTQYKTALEDDDDKTLTEKAQFLPGREAADAMRDVLRPEEQFTDKDVEETATAAEKAAAEKAAAEKAKAAADEKAAKAAIKAAEKAAKEKADAEKGRAPGA